jgi:hypothetical protein
METIHLSHVLSCSEDTFWRLALDEAFSRTLYLEVLGYQRWEQVSFEETPVMIRRVTHLTPPKLDLPGVLKKLARTGVSYEQVEVLDRSARRMQTEIMPRSFRDRITIHATTRTEALEAGACRRVFEATLAARIFPVGGLVEKQIAAGMERAYARSAAYVNEYVGQASARSGAPREPDGA